MMEKLVDWWCETDNMEKFMLLGLVPLFIGVAVLMIALVVKVIML